MGTHRATGGRTGRPAEALESEVLQLLRSDRADRDELVDAINSSLDELRPWMPWAQVPATPDSVSAFLGQAHEDWETGHGFAFAIRSAAAQRPGTLLGYCGLHARVGPGGLEIGYWVRTEQTGRGVATAAAALLTRSALALDDVRRVEIHCDAANLASAAVPRKLGYRLDRIDARPPQSPGETDRHMVWLTAPGR